MMPWLMLLFLMIALTIISITTDYLHDERNQFLKNFVNHEFLAMLGFTVTITLGSVANIHLQLNSLEDVLDRNFDRTALRRSSLSMIWLFVVAFIIVLTKPIMPQDPVWIVSLFNSSAILIFYFNVMVLFDITKAAFKIPPVKALIKKKRRRKKFISPKPKSPARVRNPSRSAPSAPQAHRTSAPA